MGEGNIRNYQVNYAINATGDAAAYFTSMAENIQKMIQPLNNLQAQVHAVSRSLHLLGQNENLKNLFALKPTLDISNLKTSLTEAEKLVETSANRMAAKLDTAFAKATVSNSKSFKSLDKTAIQDKINQLKKDFTKISGGKIIDNIKRPDQLNEAAKKIFQEHKGYVKQLEDFNAKATKTASAILNSTRNTQDITNTARAIRSLNKAVGDFNNKKSIRVKVDADISKAVSKFNSFLKTVQNSVATVPLTVEPTKKAKGKTTTKTNKNVIPATSENITNLIKDKTKAISIKSQFNGNELVAQLNESIANLQKLANEKPIRLKETLLPGNVGFQLNESIANLQKLANEKPIKLTTSVTPVQSLKGNNTQSTTSNTKTNKNTSTQNTNTTWAYPTQSEKNAAWRHIDAMGNLAIAKEIDKFKFKNSVAEKLRANQAAFYESVWGQNAINKNNKNIIANTQLDSHNARELARVRALSAQPIQPVIIPSGTKATSNLGRRSYSVKVPDIFANTKSKLYQFTGNTSFGARTPMAVDMAKSMGTMFAIGGAMSAIGSSLSQAVNYQNIMKTTNAILKNGTDTYSDSGFKIMEQTVRQVGKDTKFTAPEVASASKFLAMAGYDIPAINTAIKPISNLALIGDTNLGETADKMTNVMTTFGIAPAKMNDIADIITTTFTRSNTDMMMLAESAKYAGGIANLYGGSFKNNFADVMAMFGVLGNTGIQSSSAGTTLRMMYQNLMQPNKNQRALLKKYKIYSRDTNGNPLEMIDILKQIASKVPQNKLADAIGGMFRITAQPGAATLATSLKDGENSSLIKLMEANRNAAGTGISENIAKEKKNTISGLWAQVQSTFTEGIVQAFEGKEGGWAGQLIKLRDYLAQPETVESLRSLVDLVENLAKIIGTFAKWYAKVYNFMPDIINFWMYAQLAFTQFGYLLTPFVQLTGVLSTLKTAIFGVSAAATTATVVENTMGRARKAGVVASVASSTVPSITNKQMNGLVAANIAAGMAQYQYFKPYNKIKGFTTRPNIPGPLSQVPAILPLTFGLGNKPIYQHGRLLATGSYLRAGVSQVMPFNKYSGNVSAILYGATPVAENAAKYRMLSQKWGDISTFKNISDAQRAKATQRADAYLNAAILASQMQQQKELAEKAAIQSAAIKRQGEIRDIALARHASRGVVASDVRERYAKMYGWKAGAKMTWGTSFKAGQALGTLSLASMLGSIKSMALSLFSGLAKAIGMLTSPIGLAVGALTALGVGIYKVYKDAKERKEQLELAKQNSTWVSNSYKQIESDYLNASIEAGGFKPITVGYAKLSTDEEKTFSLDNTPIISVINDKTKKLTGKQIYSQYVQNYKFLPEYITEQWKRDSFPFQSLDEYVKNHGGYTDNIRANVQLRKDFRKFTMSHRKKNPDKLREEAQRIAVISQWAKLATEQADVKQAEKDLQNAIFNKDFKRAQDIVNAYKPKSMKHMSQMFDANTISQITDPTQYYEWQYAQYKVLADLQNKFVGPSQNYQKAMGMIADLKGMKKTERQDYDATNLVQTIISAIPISFNGTTAQITLDKMGRVDWIALANSVNNGIPFTIGEQQDILKNTYDAIYNDPNIKNFASVIDLLQTYLPQIANARSPYDEGHWTGWGENAMNNDETPALPSPLKPQDPLLHFTPNLYGTSIQNIVPTYTNSLDNSVKKNDNSLIKGTIALHQSRPDLFPNSQDNKNNNLSVGTYTRNGIVGGSDKQKDYKNTYDRSAARPTQVIINIDKLANFDRTAIAKNADERAITEAIENKIAEAVMMLSSQALNSASSLISQGI